MGGVYSHINFNLYHYAGNNPVKYTDPDGRKIIIGITTSNDVWGKNVGQHAFIMYIDEIDPKRSLMLDASGRYGGGRTSDVIDGYHAEISIDAYLRYFDTDEILTTFELNLSWEEEEKIVDAISMIEGYSWLQCANEASQVLNENLSKEIKKTNKPAELLKSLISFFKNHPVINVTIRQYDFKTNKEIEQNDEK
jgi:hypothetical protein